MSKFDFTYADEQISTREIFIAVPSMILAIGILSLPRTLLNITDSVDGWISIAIAGTLAVFFAWVAAKLAIRFPEQQFFEYSTKIISKPLAGMITFYYVLHFLSYAVYESRMIATISKQYIFDRTPVEVISLVFILLVAYGVSGSRAALLRVNMMFFPIILFILFLVLLFNIQFFEISNLKPFFQTSWIDILKGVNSSAFSFLGFEILLFYISLVHKDKVKEVSKLSIYGIVIITITYLLVFFVAIAVFSVAATKQIAYPTVELAKEVNVPGGVIERIDPLFFTVWVMTIFNTVAMAFDIAVMSLQSVFPKLKKSVLLFTLLPIIYLFSMLPQDHIQLEKIGDILGYSGMMLAAFIPSLLLIVSILRGVKG